MPRNRNEENPEPKRYWDERVIAVLIKDAKHSVAEGYTYWVTSQEGDRLLNEPGWMNAYDTIHNELREQFVREYMEYLRAQKPK
jgi:hypothetical protein